MQTMLQLLVVALSLSAATLSAAPVTTFADITHWVGSGSNQSALVIDFNNGSDPLVWGYRYDGVKSGEDMFRAVVADDDRLFARIGVSGSFGLPIYGIGYDRNNNGIFTLSDLTAFDADGFAVTGPSDTATATNVGDDYQEGWFSAGFWGYYNAVSSPYAGGAWLDAMTGTTDRILANDSWDGLSFAPGFNFTAPSQPSTSTAVALPEPDSQWCALIALLVCAVAYGVRRQRRLL